MNSSETTASNPEGSHWILTAFGNRFYFDRGSILAYHYPVEEIALALSRICRFGGHCIRFYSVAHHSVLVADILRRLYPEQTAGKAGIDLLVAALFHDAGEAYLGDMVRPLKVMPQFAAFREMEKLAGECAIRAAGSSPNFDFYGTPYPEVIKRADNIAIATERRDIMPTSPDPWTLLGGAKPIEGISTLDYLKPYDGCGATLFLNAYRAIKAGEEILNTPTE